MCQSIQRIYESSPEISSRCGSSIDDLLPDVLRDFAQVRPEIGIRQFQSSPSELAERLERRILRSRHCSRPYRGMRWHIEELGRSVNY